MRQITMSSNNIISSPQFSVDKEKSNNRWTPCHFFQNKDTLIGRNNAIIDHNLPLWAGFFAKYNHLFECQRPDGSCMGFAKYKGPEGIDAFAETLIQEAGILILPSAIYRSELGQTPDNYFRYGYGRTGLAEGLEAFDAYLSQRK